MENQESLKDVLVIGGGRFGRLAVQRLEEQVRLVVEINPEPELLHLGVPVLKERGEVAAYRLLAAPDAPFWVVPAAPNHFVLDWLRVCFGLHRTRTCAPPDKCLPKSDWVWQGRAGEVYLSLADFQCPDDCPEPAQACTVTGEPRGRAMYQRLEDIECPGWQVGILRSFQMAPGVGAVRVSDMKALRENVDAGRSKWLIGTACRCHGVLQGMEFL